MEFFKVVALLCQINIGAMGISIDKIREEQIACHKYYAECVGNPAFADSKINQCVKDRK